MFRKSTCLISFVVVLIVAHSAIAQLVGHWTFDEGSGTMAADSSGRGNDGTVMGDATWVAGQMGSSALNFDDSDDIVIIDHDASLDIEDALTISLWVNTPNVVAPNHMFTKQPSGTAPDNYPGNYEFRVKDNTIQFLHQTSQGTDYSEYHSISQITAGEWYHAAVSIVEGDFVEFYLNGVSAGSVAQSGTFGVLNDDSLRIGGRKDNHFFNGILDDVYIYARALTLDQIASLSDGVEPTFRKAENPSIPDGTVLESTWANLAWTPGDAAVSHDVYIGESFEDVNSGAESTFRGNQAGTFLVIGFPGFPYPDGLVSGTTYYWRIDEVNEADPNSPWKGDIWSFSIAPKTAYFPDPPDGAEFIGPDNVTLTWTAGFGAKLHTVYFGESFDEVNDAVGGAPGGVTIYNPGPLESAKVYYWRVDEFDAVATYKGDVWSFSTPGAVGSPQPAYKATDIAMNVKLNWTDADSAFTNHLYFGTDKEAVRNADTSAPEYKGSIFRPDEIYDYDPGLLEADTAYYWHVDAVDAQDNVSKGPLWVFTTGAFLLVDDFEIYTDDDAANRAIWQTWIDGFGVPDNGAQVGYLMPPYAEQTTVHGGLQSMPLLYINETGVTNSEATTTLTVPRDWTQAGVAQLSLWFRGASGNAAEPLYVSIANSAGAPAVVANDDSSAATVRAWTQWMIPLQAFADQGINLSNVDQIAVGLGSTGGAAAGGSGTMYIDDIRLYRSGEAATP
jgi:hypothetical protein